MGMRSRAPPVADAARRSIRSGRKNRASEQREDFFGHRKAARTAIGQGVHRRKSRCRDQNLNKQLFAQTALPRYGGGGRGGGKCACGYFGSVSVRSTDDAFASFVSSTASDRKGFVKGESVPLDRILVPFVRTKGTPPRRAVLTMPLQKAPRRRRQDEIWYKGGRGARVRDYIFPRGNPAGRRKKLAPQGFDNLRNVH